MKQQCAQASELFHDAEPIVGTVSKFMAGKEKFSNGWEPMQTEFSLKKIIPKQFHCQHNKHLVHKLNIHKEMLWPTYKKPGYLSGKTIVNHGKDAISKAKKMYSLVDEAIN